MNKLNIGYEVNTFCPNSPHSQVSIRFQVTYHDWKTLEESEEWKAFSNLLLECQIKNNQTYQNMEKGW